VAARTTGSSLSDVERLTKALVPPMAARLARLVAAALNQECRWPALFAASCCLASDGEADAHFFEVLVWVVGNRSRSYVGHGGPFTVRTRHVKDRGIGKPQGARPGEMPATLAGRLRTARIGAGPLIRCGAERFPNPSRQSRNRPLSACTSLSVHLGVQ
jgi:hypothetical protein